MKLLPLPCVQTARLSGGSDAPHKMVFPSPVGDVKIVSSISTFCAKNFDTQIKCICLYFPNHSKFHNIFTYTSLITSTNVHFF